MDQDRLLAQFAFAGDHDSPPLPYQGVHDPFVPRYVACDLPTPIIRVGFWFSRAALAMMPVPEAAMLRR